MHLSIIGALIDRALTEPPDLLVAKGHHRYAPYYHFMYLLAEYMSAHKKKVVCVELGVEEGRGVASFAAVSPRVDVYGIDNVIHDPSLGAVLATYSNITFMHRDSVPAPLDQLPPIDILHIDTDHTFAIAKAEFEAYRPGLASGAVVLFDDLYCEDGGVQRYFFSIRHNIRIQDDRLHFEGYGIVLMP